MKAQENGWGKKEKLYIVAFNRQFLRGDATCRLLFSLRSVAGRGHGCRKSSSKTAVVRNIGNGEGKTKTNSPSLLPSRILKGAMAPAGSRCSLDGGL